MGDHGNIGSATSIKEALKRYEEKENHRRRDEYEKNKKIEMEKIKVQSAKEEAKEAQKKATEGTATETNQQEGEPIETSEGGPEQEDLDGEDNKNLDGEDGLTKKSTTTSAPKPASFRTDPWIKLWGMIPPITKMDTSLTMISHCEKLSLSTNQIDKIQNLATFKNIKILSLSRNNLKNLAGIEAVADTLTELWVSFNWIEKLKAVTALKKLEVFYISYNLIKHFDEVQKLGELPELRELTLLGNLLQTRMEEEGHYRTSVANTIKSLKRLDCTTVLRDE